MRATIFLRTRNEEEHLEECLKMVFSQRSSVSFDVIALDSSSEDRSVDILKSFDIRIFSIPKEFFSYSKALNFGVQKSDTELFVPLSGHCLPYDEHWLEKLTKPFRESEKIAASFSRQIAWPEASAPERRALAKAFPENAFEQSREHFEQLLAQGEEPYQCLRFSNSSACIRRELLLEHPFLELPFAEDRAFAFQCLQAGHRVSYCPESVVYHSHYPNREEFRSVARSATLARAQINLLAGKELAVSSSHLSAIKPSLLFFALPVIAVFYLLSGYPFRNSWREYFRLLRFYEASIGTSQGKQEASKNSKVTLAQVADPDELLSEAKELS